MVNKVNVEFDIPFNSIPGDRVFQLSYQENINATTDTANVANEANEEASKANTRNNEQDIKIEANDKDIKDTRSQLSEVQSKSELNKQELNSHISSDSAHGVSGSNVGTDDYAQELTGGVVLLSGNVLELTSYSAPAAPATYDQIEEQAFRAGIESEINTIVTKINEIIQGQITAKQMGS